MSGTWKFKFTLLFCGVLFAIYTLMPTALGLKEKRLALEKQGVKAPWYYNLLPEKELNLGLDLRGGLYMEMEVGIKEALKQQINFFAADIDRLILSDYEEKTDDPNKTVVYEATQIHNNMVRVEIPQHKKDEFYSQLVEKFGNQSFTIENERPEIFLKINSHANEARKVAFEAINKAYPEYKGDILLSHQDKYLAVSFESSLEKRTITELLSEDSFKNNFELIDQGIVQVVYLTPSDMFLNDVRRNIINQAANSVRNRIDRFGVAEASVSRQSTDRLVIELPGIKDPDQVIKVIKRTGKLEFRIVNDDIPFPEVQEMVFDKQKELNIKKLYKEESVAQINEALKGDLPANTEIVFELEREPQTKKVVKTIPYLLYKEAQVTGDMLSNASVQTKDNMPYVLMNFNKVGMKKFGKLTSDNVGKRLAIVLDDVVTSAPVIRTAITAGSAQIELGIGPYNTLLMEAKEIVMILKEGALPASLTIATKNIIGPSLGKDSIDAGLMSLMIAAIAIICFMLVYYKVGGIVANTALAVNVVFVFGILTLFQASLTLPGIAGIVLTLGMAVDANVIIFERMREEKYLGQEVGMVVDSGYGNAMSAIIDGNITTFIAGLVLFEFGTGPIKGFATTLMIGIATTLITAIVLTRVIYDWMIQKLEIKTLKI